MLQSPYKDIQENLNHIGYNYPILARTVLTEVLEKDLTSEENKTIARESLGGDLSLNVVSKTGE